MKVELRSLDKVYPYEKNVKRHDEKQVEKIAQSIKDFGWDQPIVVDAEGVIIKGHGRRLAALHLSLKEVPVVVRGDLSEDAVRAARIADNRVAESVIDAEMLQDELSDIEYDMSGIFDVKELDFLSSDIGELNEDIFVNDLEEQVSAQSAETEDKIADVDRKLVPISKAIGFKSVEIKQEKHIVRFMAIVEDQFKLGPEESFVAFAKQMIEASK
jgi:hypothetical protein